MGIEKLNYLSAGGTCLQGYIDATYGNLVQLFGEPERWTAENSDGKVRAEWVLKIDGTLATIYDWKESKPLETIVDWHIGGKNQQAIWAVQKAFFEKEIPCYVRPSH